MNSPETIATADVIVVGGGAAGLAAARDLAARSFRVVVLEARDRLGGRIWSSTPRKDLVPAELGAEFIHGRAPQTMALLRAANQRAISFTGAFFASHNGGRLESGDPPFSAAATLFDGVRDLAEDESVDRFLHRFDGDPRLRRTAELARAFVEGFDAADPAVASARSIAAEWESGTDLTSTRPSGGYAPALQQLVNACTAHGAEIRTTTTVRRIAWRRGRVLLETTTSGKAETFESRAAVVTLPVGVLRDPAPENAVTFEPALPPEKHAALAGIEMGPVVKVALWFTTRFWERLAGGRYRNADFFRSETNPFPAYWTQYPQRSPLVVAWAGGPRAAALSDRSQSDLVQSALDGFGSLFGEADLARREFQFGSMHDWDRDPFSRGAYSYVRVGAGDARRNLAHALDATLFFAGEATSLDNQGGTVNGALETGERAAREVAAAVSAP